LGNREWQFAADAEEESQRGEAMFHAAVGHCNERVSCVGGEDAGEEVEVFSPFVVDSPHLFVEEGGEGEDFGKGICHDFEERFTGDTVELVGEVKEDSHAGREGVG